MPERGRRLLSVVRWVVPVVSALLVVAFVDLRSLGARLVRLDPRFIALFLVLSLPFYFICALRWTFTARRIDVTLPFRRAVAEYYVSTLLNQVLPVGIAGDVARAARHRARVGGSSWGPVARAVLFERASGLAVLTMVASACALGFPDRTRGQGTVAVPALVALLVVLAGALVWRWARRAGHGFGADLSAAFFERGAFVVQPALSLTALFLLLLMFTFAARAAGVPMGFASALRTVPLVFVVTTIPWPFAGWGTREGVTAALFGVVGLDAADGVAASVAFGLLSLLASTPGILPLCIPSREPR
jgi:uncharacterized membrane protein YbhN (UPF0104 family)